MRPDRNPDGFDHFRRAYVAGSLANVAASVMPRGQARKFSAFLAGLQCDETPVDPPEPPRSPRRRKTEKQRSLPLESNGEPVGHTLKAVGS